MSPLRELSTAAPQSPTSSVGPFSTAERLWTTPSAPATIETTAHEPSLSRTSEHNLNSPILGSVTPTTALAYVSTFLLAILFCGCCH